MSNESTGGRPRPRPRQTAPAPAPVGSSVAIAVTAVALVLGFFILRQLADATPGSSGGTTTSSSAVTLAPITAPPSTTEPLVFLGTLVQVANCSGQEGVARQLTLALSGLGFETSDPTNGAVRLTTSKVVYNPADEAALPVARSLSRTLGGIPVEAVSTAPEVSDGTWASGSSVIVMLGADYAGKTITEIQANPYEGTTDSVAPSESTTTTTSTP